MRRSGKRLTYVLNMGCRAMTKSTLNVHCGHDDYHCIDDTGFFQLFGKSAQEVCDLNIISHRIAELALTPGICAQDGFLTTHLIESLLLPERELIAEYLGRPDDIIDTPTPAQRILYGPQRRRIPELWTVDNPVMIGTVQNQDAYMQSVAAQRPYFFDHIAAHHRSRRWTSSIELTGRRYQPRLDVPVRGCRVPDPRPGQHAGDGGSGGRLSARDAQDQSRRRQPDDVPAVPRRSAGQYSARAQRRRGAGARGSTAGGGPAADPRSPRGAGPLRWRTARFANGHLPYPDHATYKKPDDLPPLYSGSFGLGSRDLQPEGIDRRDREHAAQRRPKKKFFYLSIDFVRDKPFTPKQEIHQIQVADALSGLKELAVHGSENPNLMPKNSITVRLHSVGGWGAITTGKNLAMTLFDLLGYHIKANPKYGSEKKGQPTTYYLSAAPEPIRINCDYFYVDVVLSPDPNVFQHSNPLAGLEEGRRVHSAERATRRRRKSGAADSGEVPAHHHREQHPRLLSGRFQDCAGRSHRSGTAIPHAGQRLPGRVLCGIAGDGAGEARRADAVQGHPNRNWSTSSARRARGLWKTTCAWCAAASTK